VPQVAATATSWTAKKTESNGKIDLYYSHQKKKKNLLQSKATIDKIFITISFK
jgi:hypothetical protein